MKYIFTVLFLTFLSSMPAAAQKNSYSLLLHWYPQAQFAGYYYALEKGYYQEEDLNIEIEFGTVTDPSTARIKTGDFDFKSASAPPGTDQPDFGPAPGKSQRSGNRPPGRFQRENNRHLERRF